MKFVSEALRGNRTLSILYLGHNKAYAEGAQYVSEGLGANVGLTALYFGLFGM